ncbi:hypothetical protein D9M69_603710 [compost metagenome]
MAHGRGDHVLVVLEVIVVLIELARDRGERTHDVLGHGRLLGDDQRFGAARCLGVARIARRFGETFGFHLYNQLSRAHARAHMGTHTHARTCMKQPYQNFCL